MIRSRFAKSRRVFSSRFLGPRIPAFLALSIVGGLLISVVELAFAYGLQGFLFAIGVAPADALQLPKFLSDRTLGQILLFLFLASAFRGLFQWGQSYLRGATMEEFRSLQRRRLLRFAFFRQSANSSQIITLFTERAGRAGMVLNHTQTVFVQTIVIGLLGISLFLISPTITLISVLFLASLVFPIRALNKRIGKAGDGLNREWLKITNRLLMSIKNLLLLRIYGMEAREEAEAQKDLRSYLGHYLTYYKLAGFSSMVPQTLGVALVCGTSYAARKWDLLTPGALISCFYLFMRVVQSVSTLSDTVSDLSFNWGQIEDMSDWYYEHAAILDNSPSADALRSSLKVEKSVSPVGWTVDDVSFSYASKDAPVLKNFSLRIPPGSATVIMGPSGVGKSTLVHLLLGEIEPQSGSVVGIMDGESRSLADARPKLLESIGYVGPESFLFEGTVRDNLFYGLRATPSEAEISEAIRLAECQFIYDFPRKLDHLITEQGQGLSAGQKQRLCLARALLRSPCALILDEATANLDLDTEHKLVETFRGLKGRLTIVAVTHKPEFLKIADQELLLK